MKKTILRIAISLSAIYGIPSFAEKAILATVPQYLVEQIEGPGQTDPLTGFPVSHAERLWRITEVETGLFGGSNSRPTLKLTAESNAPASLSPLFTTENRKVGRTFFVSFETAKAAEIIFRGLRSWDPLEIDFRSQDSVAINGGYLVLLGTVFPARGRPSTPHIMRERRLDRRWKIGSVSFTDERTLRLENSRLDEESNSVAKHFLINFQRPHDARVAKRRLDSSSPQVIVVTPSLPPNYGMVDASSMVWKGPLKAKCEVLQDAIDIFGGM